MVPVTVPWTWTPQIDKKGCLVSPCVRPNCGWGVSWDRRSISCGSGSKFTRAVIPNGFVHWWWHEKPSTILLNVILSGQFGTSCIHLPSVVLQFWKNYDFSSTNGWWEVSCCSKRGPHGHTICCFSWVSNHLLVLNVGNGGMINDP